MWNTRMLMLGLMSAASLAPFAATAASAGSILGDEFQFSATVPNQGVINQTATGTAAIGGASIDMLLPDLPAIAETYPGFEALAWNGLVVPSATPAATVQKINAEVGAILRDPEIVKKMNGFGFDLIGGTPADFAALIRSEAERWTPVVKRLGIKVD